jgi:bis(5'-nucleosyl)-tetraphosphatase (symmetrical)
VQRIFVGDVQGCADELDALIARAEAAFGEDFALWLAGDLVNRGPDNRRVLERVRALVDAGRAEVVLGNHELHLLSVHWGQRPLSENDSIGDVLDAPDVAEWVDWLRRRPLARTGEIAGQPFAMVHASVGAGWTLEELRGRAAKASARLAGPEPEARAFLAMDPAESPERDDLARLTRGRSGDGEGWSSREPDSPEGAWHQAWRAQRPAYGVVYGHWARQGLHVEEGLRGLDTGCVHHGRGRDGFLTAWLPDEEPGRAGVGRAFDLPDERFWQIPARRRYYYPSHESS